MSIYAPTAPERANAGACPRNGVVGRKVSSFTLSSQVRSEVLAGLQQREGFRFCSDEACPVVYYQGENGTCLTVEQVRFPVFQKSTDPERPVCYCFQHSVREISEQVCTTGSSTVPAEIKAQCAQGLDACERNNPQGSCCLGNVQKVVKAALQSRPASSDADEAAIEAHCAGCCAPAEALGQVAVPTPAARAGWLGVGAFISALLASACCWLPLVLLLFGASAAGMTGFFESYRPWFLGITAVLLGAGFYFIYFRRVACAPGSTCAVPDPRVRRFNQTLLWIATLFTVAMAFFPSYARFLIPHTAAPALSPVSGTPLDLNISGMTCEACAGELQETLRKVPGVRAVEVDYASKTAHLVVEPVQSTTATQAARSAITDAGYGAIVP